MTESLNCAVPQVEIRGAPDIYVMAGSGVVLHCVISGLIDTPPFIFWYHNKQRIAGSAVEKDVVKDHENIVVPTTSGLLFYPICIINFLHLSNMADLLIQL